MNNNLLKAEIEMLRNKLNNYIKDNEFSNYNELLNISQQLDFVINKWVSQNEAN